MNTRHARLLHEAEDLGIEVVLKIRGWTKPKDTQEMLRDLKYEMQGLAVKTIKQGFDKDVLLLYFDVRAANDQVALAQVKNSWKFLRQRLTDLSPEWNLFLFDTTDLDYGNPRGPRVAIEVL